MQNNLNKNLNPKALDQLINMASKKMGCSPEVLRSKLESGELEKAVRSAAPNNPQSAVLMQALNDPKTAERLLNDPAAAQILKKYIK